MKKSIFIFFIGLVISYITACGACEYGDSSGGNNFFLCSGSETRSSCQDEKSYYEHVHFHENTTCSFSWIRQ